MQNLIRAANLRDPAERWEMQSPEPADASVYRGINEVFPHTPRKEEDVPPDARDALQRACRVTSVRQLFILPWALRTTGAGDEFVISPPCVLAMGTRAVGLWAEKPEPGIKVLIPLDRLAAIEDVMVLLYGRLSFLSFEERLTVRYNTLARSGLRPALVELRERLCGSAQQLPRGEPPSPHLPLKWKRLLKSPLVRFSEDTPVEFRFAVEPSPDDADLKRGQLLVVTPHELVYLCDPRQVSHNYGEDSFTVPRARITGVRIRERFLEVASNGARLHLDMAPELRRAAAQWFPETG